MVEVAAEVEEFEVVVVVIDGVVKVVDATLGVLGSMVINTRAIGFLYFLIVAFDLRPSGTFLNTKKINFTSKCLL